MVSDVMAVDLSPVRQSKSHNTRQVWVQAERGAGGPTQSVNSARTT